MDAKKSIAILFIDFKKAFDSVSHQVLLKKLSACGFPGELHEYIQNYLSGRSQKTRVNGVESNEAPVEYDVPQGSLIGPTCFSFNVNDLSWNSPAHVLNNIQNHANMVNEYSCENSLTIDPKKCKIIILSKQKFIGPLPCVKINDNNIDIVEKTKCLGVIIDNRLTWNAHATHVCKAFSIKVKKLYKMNSLDKSTLRTIYNTGILPSVLYGILVWGNATDHLIDEIEKVHIKVARFVEKIKKATSDDEVLNAAKWKN